MNEKTRNKGFSIKEEMFKFYDIEENERGTFLLQVDWLLENAVFPIENGYLDNLIDLWNVYMPNYKFDKIVVEYSKKYFSVLRYVHDGEIFKFNSVKYMQEGAIKNFVKYRISQGEISRMVLVKECFDLFKNVSDRTKLYDIINQIVENYFSNGEIGQFSIMFLRRLQDYTEQPYKEILERLADIHEQRKQTLSARVNLFNVLNVKGETEKKFQTRINILLCKIAMSDGEQRFSDVLRDTWNVTMSGVMYSEKVYAFIEKYEKAYMNAACFSIKNIKDERVIKQLYKDAIILCAVIEAIEKNEKYSLREVKDYWKRDGMKFANGYFFDEFERMKGGFNADILIANKTCVEAFHDMLLKKIETSDFPTRSDVFTRERRNISFEMDHVALNEKERRIDELQEKIVELEEKVDNTEKEVLSQFISLLDSKKYDHVLGKLYRTAYVDEEVRMEDIQRILKNLFEIMNISGIDIYGEIGASVSYEELKKGKYRVDSEISKNAIVKYPGYRVGNSIILHPLAEEV